jgi:hypothetical protein
VNEEVWRQWNRRWREENGKTDKKFENLPIEGTGHILACSSIDNNTLNLNYQGSSAYNKNRKSGDSYAVAKKGGFLDVAFHLVEMAQGSHDIPERWLCPNIVSMPCSYCLSLAESSYSTFHSVASRFSRGLHSQRHIMLISATFHRTLSSAHSKTCRIWYIIHGLQGMELI